MLSVPDLATFGLLDREIVSICLTMIGHVFPLSAVGFCASGHVFRLSIILWGFCVEDISRTSSHESTCHRMLKFALTYEHAQSFSFCQINRFKHFNVGDTVTVSRLVNIPCVAQQRAGLITVSVLLMVCGFVPVAL